jgi:flagellar motility protein MotE (MotC chaperone)
VPVADPLAEDRAALAAERAQVAKEKAILDQKLAVANQPPHPANNVVTTSDKVTAIYATMKPSEIAAVFEKLPDPQVCDALLKMDEQKAGKVLVAMPPTRAATLTTLMNRASAAPAQAGQPPAAPATSVP